MASRLNRQVPDRPPYRGMTPEPQGIATAPEQEDHPVLLFCPEQGGWHTGIWFRGVWLAYIDTSTRLKPTHWLPMLPDPGGAFGSGNEPT